jgi:hypothetical protein
VTDRTPLDIETGNAEDLYRLPPDPSYVRLTGTGDTVWKTPTASFPAPPTSP